MQNSLRGVAILSRDSDTVLADAEGGDAALAAGGDPRAFERLYRKHLARIHTLARRMAGAEEADELTQDIFVRAWSKLDTFRGEATFGTWLYRLAINVVLARRSVLARERGRHEDGEDAFASLPARLPSTEVAVDFEAAMGRLPGGARQIFVLHDIEGYKHREIADMLGITTGTSKAQLHRARMALREHLT